MQKLCTNCHYIGKSKKEDGICLFGGAVTSILGLAFLGLGFWHPFFILGTYICITIFFIAISSCFFYDCQKCPNCKEKKLISVNSPKAQNIINMNNLTVENLPASKWEILSNYDCLKHQTRQICKTCYNIDDKSMQELCGLQPGLVLIISGIISIPLALFSHYYLIINFISLFIGILLTLTCFMKPDRCPKCKYRSLVPIDSPEAEKIIREQNLAHMIEDVPGHNLYTFHENFGLLWIITSWAILAFLMYKLFGFLKNI